MKRFNNVQYEINLPDGERITLYCSSGRVGDHTSQRVETWYKYEKVAAYSQYYNRTWERFDYETAILTLADKFERRAGLGGKANAEAIREFCRNYGREEAKKAEAWFEDFKREYAKATPGMKAALAAGPMIETEAQANTTLAILKMGNLIREMEKADEEKMPEPPPEISIL